MIEHKHFIGRFEVGKPPIFRDALEDWMADLIIAQGMRLLSGPHVEYVNKVGNRGLTGVAIIETSHCALHCWDETDPALIQLDFYTCGALNFEAINRAVGEFEVITSEWAIYDRAHGLKLLECGGLR